LTASVNYRPDEQDTCRDAMTRATGQYYMLPNNETIHFSGKANKLYSFSK